jgi:hypothetical protein
MKTKQNSDIIIDPDVIDYIKKNKGNYRVCTSCGGPALVPLERAITKADDKKIELGDQFLYVSNTLYRFGLRRIGKEVLDPETCGL